jgi:ADP-ribose pyrophosphatase
MTQHGPTPHTPTPHGPWQIVLSHEIYRDDWIHLRKDDVIRPDGRPGIHSVLTIKPGVTVLAMDDSRQVYLTEEFHYAVGRVTVEAVSGGCDQGENLLDAGRRELREELGIEAADWLDLGTIDPFTTNVVSPTRLFVARALRFHDSAPEGTELIRPVKMPLADAVAMVMDGRITHAPSCVLIVKAWLRFENAYEPEA